jgi:hypothetical protein
MRRVNLSNGRVVRVWRDRTKENLSASYDDADIVSTRARIVELEAEQ